MIHDLELTTVVDVQGTLTPVLTESDKAKLDKEVSLFKDCLFNEMDNYFLFTETLSEKLALVEVMRQYEHPRLQKYIKAIQDEL